MLLMHLEIYFSILYIATTTVILSFSIMLAISLNLSPANLIKFYYKYFMISFYFCQTYETEKYVPFYIIFCYNHFIKFIAVRKEDKRSECDYLWNQEIKAGI